MSVDEMSQDKVLVDELSLDKVSVEEMSYWTKQWDICIYLQKY